MTSIENLTGVSGKGQGELLPMVMGLVTQGGGIRGVLQKFAAQGMGEVAGMWVANGPNPPITAEQFTKVFGQQQVNLVARQMGVLPQQAAQGLAAVLPLVIDKLTPDGQAVDGGALESNVFKLMGGGTQGLGIGDVMKLFGN